MFNVGDKVWFYSSNGVRVGEIKSKQKGKYNVLATVGTKTRRYVLKDKEMKDLTPQAELKAVEDYMFYLARTKNVSPTENMPKIAKARVMMKLGFDKCPCGGDDRDCISEKCLKEIAENGICHCQAFKRK